MAEATLVITQCVTFGNKVPVHSLELILYAALRPPFETGCGQRLSSVIFGVIQDFILTPTLTRYTTFADGG